MDPLVSARKFDADIALLQTDGAEFAAARGWRIVTALHPTLAVALRHRGTGSEIEFRFHCDDWDDLPPSLTLHDPADGRELEWGEWPQGVWSTGERHPSTGKPFLCLPGIREYHTHSSHRGDLWSGYRLRGTYRLPNIVDRVAQRYQDTNG